MQLLRTAIRYTNMRVEWLFMTAAERHEVDRQRSAAHKAFIDAVNILSWAMGQVGQDNSWRQVLGDNAAKHDVLHPKDTHLFSCEDAVLAYFVCRAFGIKLRPLVELHTEYDQV